VTGENLILSKLKTKKVDGCLPGPMLVSPCPRLKAHPRGFVCFSWPPSASFSAQKQNLQAAARIKSLVDPPSIARMSRKDTFKYVYASIYGPPAVHLFESDGGRDGIKF
jgi:hypothetical protein